jgi:hypothetical protein
VVLKSPPLPVIPLVKKGKNDSTEVNKTETIEIEFFNPKYTAAQGQNNFLAFFQDNQGRI